MAISDVTKPMALDETLQDTNDLITAQNGKIDTLNTNVGNVAKDTTLQATNTALGLLGKDTSLQAIVTALATIGLNSVGNLASLTTEQKTSLVAAINELNSSKVNTSSVGVANGVAELDNTGKVPATQLPSFVDDVLEYASVSAFPATGESGKIYVALDTNKTYRWGGSGYVVISETLALGETSSTAYRGDRGKTAYDHSQDASRVTSATSVGLYKVGATAEGHVSGLTAVEKADITALGIPGQDTTYNDATQSTHGLMSTSDKIKLDEISSNAKKVEASTTNGNIKIDGVETQVYDDSDVTGAISDLGDDVEAIEDELSTGTNTVEGNPINFTTKSAQKSKSTILSLEPIQDLHGYDKPWVGGAGKNLLPLTVQGIKDANSSATWTGNSCVISNVTFTILTDDDGNVTGIKVNGTATAEIVFTLGGSLVVPSGTYTYSGYAENNQNIRLRFRDSGGFFALNNSTLTATRETEEYTISKTIVVPSGAVASNLVFTPMMCLSNASNPTTFASYTNICPISGRSSVGINGGYKSLIDISQNTNGKIIDASGNIVDDSNITLTDYIEVEPNTFCIFSGIDIHKNPTQSSPQAINVRVNYFNSSKVWKYRSGVLTEGDLLFTTDSDTKYVRISYSILGTDANIYHQNSNDLTISLGQTVYGGTLDVENGVLVAFPRFLDLGDLTWEVRESVTARANLPANAKFISQGTKVNAISSRYEICPQSEITQHNACITFNSAVQIYVRDTTASFTTPESVQQYLSGAELCYELATPITINLTPHTINLLKGVNNISTDGDKITLTYRDGSVATLGDLTSAVDNFNSKIDESKILTDTVTGDKYILVVTNGVLSVEQISN